MSHMKRWKTAEAKTYEILSVTRHASDLDSLVVTDTIPLKEDAQKSSHIRQISVAELLGETIRRISKEESVSSLFLE